MLAQPQHVSLQWPGYVCVASIPLCLYAAAVTALSGLCEMQALVDDPRVGHFSSRLATRDAIHAGGAKGGRALCCAAPPHR